jgi:hypothetical protein
MASSLPYLIKNKNKQTKTMAFAERNWFCSVIMYRILLQPFLVVFARFWLFSTIALSRNTYKLMGKKRAKTVSETMPHKIRVIEVLIVITELCASVKSE